MDGSRSRHPFVEIIFLVHAVDAVGVPVVRKALRRAQVLLVMYGVWTSSLQDRALLFADALEPFVEYPHVLSEFSVKWVRERPSPKQIARGS